MGRELLPEHGGFNHTRWKWNGARFGIVRTWHDSSYKS